MTNKSVCVWSTGGTTVTGEKWSNWRKPCSMPHNKKECLVCRPSPLICLYVSRYSN